MRGNCAAGRLHRVDPCPHQGFLATPLAARRAAVVLSLDPALLGRRSRQLRIRRAFIRIHVAAATTDNMTDPSVMTQVTSVLGWVITVGQRAGLGKQSYGGDSSRSGTTSNTLVRGQDLVIGLATPWTRQSLTSLTAVRRLRSKTPGRGRGAEKRVISFQFHVLTPRQHFLF